MRWTVYSSCASAIPEYTRKFARAVGTVGAWSVHGAVGVSGLVRAALEELAVRAVICTDDDRRVPKGTVVVTPGAAHRLEIRVVPRVEAFAEPPASVRTVELGAIYDTKKQGVVTKVTWTAQNVSGAHEAWVHGIKRIQGFDEWREACSSNIAAWCYYDNDASKGTLFNLPALAVLNQNCARGGWAVATYRDYQALWDHVFEKSGGKLQYSPGALENKEFADAAKRELCATGDGKFGAVGRWFS